MIFFTVGELADMLKLSQSQIYALIDEGRLKCHRFTRKRSGAIRVSQMQLDAYLRSTETGTVVEVVEAEEEPEPQPPLRKKTTGGGIDLW